VTTPLEQPGPHSEAPLHECRIEAVLRALPDFTPHLPAGLGPLWAGMERDAVASALSGHQTTCPKTQTNA
jgi:hypothetical protein